MKVSVPLLGPGLITSGCAHNLGILMLGTMMISIGFHFYYPSNSSVVLIASGEREAPEVLGRLRSVSALAAVIGTAVIWLVVGGLLLGRLSLPDLGVRDIFLVTGGVVIAASLLAVPSSHGFISDTVGRTIVFRREYWLYYLLIFLIGSRRYVFFTLAVFLLVQVHGTDVRLTATPFVISNLTNAYASAQSGKLVSRFGERRVLTTNSAGLIGVFLATPTSPIGMSCSPCLSPTMSSLGLTWLRIPAFRRSPLRQKRSRAMPAWPKPLTRNRPRLFRC